MGKGPDFERLEDAFIAVVSKDDGREKGTLSREEALSVISNTPGVPYPAGMTSEKVFDLLVRADFLHQYEEDRYKFNPSKKDIWGNN